LTEVFHLSSTEIDYIMYNYFRFDIRSQQSTTYNEFIAIALEIYFIEILFNRKYQQNPQLQKNTQISIREFINLLFENLFFIKVRPSKQDLLTIFEILDNDKDGFISFQQYIKFIREYLGRGLEIVDKPIKQEQLKPEPAVEGVSEVEVKFVELIWGELKKYFDNYDQGHKGYLQESELKSFAVEVLNESSQRELDYIFWNLFRVDGNYNKEVDFE
jgi:Ca2+-binding EF-hand superfamily protein